MNSELCDKELHGACMTLYYNKKYPNCDCYCHSLGELIKHD